MFKEYEAMLKVATKNGVEFKLPQLNETFPQSPILRHDIDFFLTGLEEMAEIENTLGFQAAYLFRLDAGTYNFFSLRCQKSIEKIIELGHNIGVHVDPRSLGEGSAHLDKFIEFLECVSARIGYKFRFISWHRPFEFNLGSADNHLQGLINLYAKDYWQKDFYISDSAGFWSQEKNEKYIKLCESKVFFQLLIHTEWWSTSPPGLSFSHAWARNVISDLNSIQGEVRSFGQLDLSHNSIEYLCTNRNLWMNH